MLRLQVEENPTYENPPSFQSPAVDDGTFHYSRLPEETLSLSIRKLDGTCFDVVVLKSATIEDLKLGVQNVFDHMPNNGPHMISWVHVWRHFCLSYGDQKLIRDTELILNYGIKDADQLRLIRYVSAYIDSTNVPKIKEIVPRNHSYQLLVSEEEEEEGKVGRVVAFSDGIKVRPIGIIAFQKIGNFLFKF